MQEDHLPIGWQAQYDDCKGVGLQKAVGRQKNTRQSLVECPSHLRNGPPGKKLPVVPSLLSKQRKVKYTLSPAGGT